MKRFYVRLARWLARPAFDLRSDEPTPPARNYEALSARIDTVQASVDDNSAAIWAETNARQAADTSLHNLFSLKMETAVDGRRYASGIGWRIGSNGSLEIDEEDQEPTAFVTIPRLGESTEGGQVRISVRVEIDGLLYGADKVLIGKVSVPYSHRLKLIPMLVA